MTNTWIISLVGGVVGGGLMTYLVNRRLKENEVATQIDAHRNALRITLEQDALFCGELARNLAKVSPGATAPIFSLQGYVLTTSELLYQVISFPACKKIKALSDEDIGKLVSALRQLAIVILYAPNLGVAFVYALEEAEKLCQKAANSLRSAK